MVLKHSALGLGEDHTGLEGEVSGVVEMGWAGSSVIPGTYRRLGETATTENGDGEIEIRVGSAGLRPSDVIGLGRPLLETTGTIEISCPGMVIQIDREEIRENHSPSRPQQPQILP